VLVAGLGAATAACSKFSNSDTPAAPSGPPAAGSSIVYTAVGASDAAGVGSSAVCVPFTDCPDGKGYVPTAVRTLKAQGLVEIARVIKPGGRLVIADFTRKQERRGLAARFHAGGSRLHELAALVADAGFVQVDVEEMRPPRFSAFPGAGFVRAYKSADAYAINENAG